MKFTFSGQKKQNSSKPERSQREKNTREPLERKNLEEVFERLKEDARAYGYEFDKARGVFRPLSVF